MLRPPAKQIGLEICVELSPADLAEWREKHPAGEVVETRPDGGGLVVSERFMT